MTLRVVYVTHYAQLYGANRSMVDLLREEVRTGVVEPCVIAPEEGPLTAMLDQERIPYAIIPFGPWMSERSYTGRAHHRLEQHFTYAVRARRNAMHNRSILPRVLAQVAIWGGRIIHLNSLAVGIGGGIVEGAQVPVVWHVREMPERHYGMHIDVGHRRYRKALSRAAHRVAISEAARQDVMRTVGNGVPVEVIPNGVFTLAEHTEALSDASERWQRHDPFTFLMVGVLHPGKGHEEALRALALVRERFPEVSLHVVGAGKQESLKASIADLRLNGAVHFFGHQTDVRPFYRDAHALLMCSRNEAFGRVTVEAMVYGLPVIGRAEGGTLEVLDGGQQGLLYGHGHEELAARMLELVTDRALASDVGRRGRAHVREKYDIERCTMRMVELYRSLIGGRPGSTGPLA